MSIPCLCFRDRTQQGPFFHLTTVEWSRNRFPGLHTHDYQEIFWLVRGICEHRINGGRTVLEEGDMVLMRKEDRHALRPVRGEGFRFTNLSWSPDTTERVRLRYPEEYRFLYAETRNPRTRRLGRGEMGEVEARMRDLAAGPHTRMALERTILNVWSRWMPRGRVEERAAPDWLRDALLRVEEPEWLVRGVGGLVTLAGRSAAHVSRECRRTLGKTPTQLMTAARMRRAAHLLRMTSRTVLEISGDCGFENPAQFHRCFKAEYGLSPGRYRREA